MLFRDAAYGWMKDNAPRLSAALAYYSIFSLAPLLIIVIFVSGRILGEAGVGGRIASQIGYVAGDRAAGAVRALLPGVTRSYGSASAALIGLALLLFGASSAFSELKDAMNTIWGVAIKPGRPVLTMVRARAISFTMVLATGLLLLASLAVSTALAACGASVQRLLPLPGLAWQWADLALSVVIVTLLFGVIYKVVPNVMLRWRDVWPGAATSGILFTLSKFAIGLYLGTSSVASYYGAAGSVIVILLWVYFSACILFFGAELTKAYVEESGHGIVPDRWAEMRAGNQGKSLDII